MPESKAGKLDETGVAILKALLELGAPSTCKEIASKAGLDVRKVVGKVRGLMNAGYIERTAEGKYKITEKGKEAISAK
uniref:Transcription regulator TrmB N-terminal domain-containing protein n=1 Tax=Thermofilum pendens TaxID=2269 RepID=A0A7C1P4T5_THEPE